MDTELGTVSMSIKYWLLGRLKWAEELECENVSVDISRDMEKEEPHPAGEKMN